MNEIIPIALFVYNRPNHVQKVLESLKRNNIDILYIFSDSWKDQDDQIKVEKVRAIVRNIDWCEKHIIERDTSSGCANSIRDGINYVLNRHDKIIVIEDDIVLLENAFSFTKKALLHFENDERVMSVSMWNHKIITKKNFAYGFFSKRFVCWGWGTYRRGWNLYCDDPMVTYKECISNGINLKEWGEDLLWQAVNAKKRDLWDIDFTLTHFKFNKQSYFFPSSLVINIGRDLSGHNTGGGFQDIQADIDSFWMNNFVIPKFNGIEIDPKNIRKYFSPRRSIVYHARNIAGKILRKLKIK